MTMILKDGDYRPDGGGAFRSVSGTDELLHWLLFQLTARRGAFPFLPKLGSRLYRLPQEKASQRAALAKQYVEEALAEEPGLEIEAVLWNEEKGELTLYASWGEERLRLAWSPNQTGGIV